MPKNIRRSKGTAIIRKYFNHKKAQLLCGQPRKISKATVTRIYAEQLKPLYPYLTKAHVKAALTLSDNNMHESRLLLDMKYSFLQMRKAIESTLFVNTSRFRSQINENAAGDYTLPKDKKPHRADDSFSTITVATSRSSSLSNSRNTLKDDNITADSTVLTTSLPSGSSSFTTISANESHSSSVYDFSETESEPGSVESWFSYRCGLIKRAPPNRKIGVVITRCENGYKACLL